MTALADLIKRRDDLRAARARGVQSVAYAGKTVTYKTDAQMAAALADLDRQIAAAEGRPRRRILKIATSKGV